MKTDRPIERKK